MPFLKRKIRFQEWLLRLRIRIRLCQNSFTFSNTDLCQIFVPTWNSSCASSSKNRISRSRLIVPIPLHRRRLRWRGFNQSTLGKYLSKNFSPACRSLFRTAYWKIRYTLPQMGIKDFLRRKSNIKKAFAVRDKSAVKNKVILLVDDIATTGSTIFECARALKDAGAKEIYAIVVARQEIKNNR